MRHDELLRLFGNPARFSPGTATILADRQLKRRAQEHTVTMDWMGNAKTQITDRKTGRWYIMRGGYGQDNSPTVLLGAACGDAAGSVYERHNIKHKLPPAELIHPHARITDDSVMTFAVAEGLRLGLGRVDDDWLGDPEAEKVIFEAVREAMHTYGRKYPWAGYGGKFVSWICSDDPRPYNSWGNGSAMRCSYAGWVARSLAEAEKLAAISAEVTHNHPEGIKGAVVVAGCIRLLREGKDKAAVRAYAEQFYDLSFTLDSIRDSYRFDVSCAGSVPQAILAFLEEDCYADVIAAAISIGGDSDTIAAIAGSMAEVIYPIPQNIRGAVIDLISEELQEVIVNAVDFAYHRQA